MAHHKSSDGDTSVVADVESQSLLGSTVQQEDSEKALPNPASPPFERRLLFWISLNVLATIGIVFTNKLLLTTPSLRHAQLLFAAYHFLLTHLTLHICSSPSLAFFSRGASPPFTSLLPIAIAMSLNVILPNLSLAHSSIAFYQTARVLLTPCTALLNLALFSQRISRRAALALIPVCLGVAAVTYYDVRRPSGPWTGQTPPSPPRPLIPHLPWPLAAAAAAPTPARLTSGSDGGGGGGGTSALGALFALAGVLASSLYTLLIAHSTASLRLSSPQLLHRQSLLGGLLLLWLVPWLDTLPVVSAVTPSQWMLVLVSGTCAVLINLSQFVIVAGAGPVASTVVGHAKTVGVVGVGWVVMGTGWDLRAACGVVVAVGGMGVYSLIEARERRGGFVSGTGQMKRG